jgi:hypothetical protein
MTFTCADLDEALRGQEPAALEAARAHAQSCARCQESLEIWGEIATAAPGLRQSWESPDLWPRIHRALAEESQRRQAREGLWSWRRWRTAAAAAGLVAAVGSWLVLRSLAPSPALVPAPGPGSEGPERRLLTERALQEVERSEAEYVASIDRLAKVAEPLLENPSTPLLASYREKVQLLDAAIADCRAEIGRNRFNAHLRRELLSIYQEKQRTLRALMKERT